MVTVPVERTSEGWKNSLSGGLLSLLFLSAPSALSGWVALCGGLRSAAVAGAAISAAAANRQAGRAFIAWVIARALFKSKCSEGHATVGPDSPGRHDQVAAFLYRLASAARCEAWRRRVASPIAPKPTNIIAQVEGSGTPPG